MRSPATADVIETYVGGGNGDGDLAINAIIDPRGLVAVGDPQRPDLYIADGKNNRVRRVDGASGLIETVAGNGTAAFSGDGGQGQNAALKFPLDVAVDSARNVYIVDYGNNRIRKVNVDGQITTIAGTGLPSWTGDGVAAQVAISSPYGITIGPDGYVYIADFGNNRIRKIGPPGCTPSTCVITTVVGNGTWGYSGDGFQGINAALRNPSDVTFDSGGNMYIADWGNNRVRRVTTDGIITTIAGGGTYGPNGSIGDGGIATGAVMQGPVQLALDAGNNLYVADTSLQRIRRIYQAGGVYVIDTVAGNGGTGSTGDNGLATNATLYPVWGVAATTLGTFWLSQTTSAPLSLDNRVRKVQTFGTIQSVVGGGLGDGSAATNAIVDPRGAEAVAAGGPFPDLYFADGANNAVRHVDGSTGTIETVAGTGVAGYTGDNGDARNATLKQPLDVAYDENTGDVYVADTFNNVVRKIHNGIITTVAGTGSWGYNGDGVATQSMLKSPRGIDIDRAGNLYICDYEGYRVRKVSNGQMTTIAGNGQWGDSGDGQLAVNAMLRGPWDVAVAPDGTVYIADPQATRVRRVSGGIITSVISGLANPTILSLNATGSTLYIGEGNAFKIRSVNPLSCVWPNQCTAATVAGNGQSGVSGDGGPPLSASFSEPTGVAIDSSGGFLFIGSKDDDRIRMVQFSGIQPTATFTSTPTWTSIPSTPTRTPTISSTPTRTGTATRTNTPAASTASVSGHVKYYSNQVNVPNVQVGLLGPVGMGAATDSAGNFTASGVPLGTWSLTPGKTGGAGSAVSSLDAARVLQVIAGLQSFTPQQRLACDVTGDGNLSALDAVRILQYSAGVIDRLPVATTCNSDWLFVPSPAAPGQSVTASISSGSCQQGQILISQLLTSATNQNFDAILFGDCTGNWSPSVGGSLRRLTRPAVVHAGYGRWTRSNHVRIPIYVQSSADLHALDLALSYDDATLSFVRAELADEQSDALVSAHANPGGSLTVSVASGTPIDPHAGTVLLLEFAAGSDTDCAAVRLTGADVDEQPARVVTHDSCE